MFKRNQIFKVLGVTMIVSCAVMTVKAADTPTPTQEQTQVAYVPGNGDVNGDGTIDDANDLTSLRECLIDSATVDSDDMDGDSSTTIKDIVRLKRFLYNTENDINDGTGIVIDTTGFDADDKETVTLSNGSSAEGYVIDSASELYGYASLMQDENKRAELANTTLILDANIALNKVVDGTVSPQNEWLPIEEFAGTFDGKDHTIRGLYMGSTATTNTNKQRGLFSVSENPITVQNLSLTEGYIHVVAGGDTGAILGQGSGTFTQLHTDVEIYNNSNGAQTWLGGIVGNATDVVAITKCWAEGDMTTNSDLQAGVGGILGQGKGVSNEVGSTVTACLYSGHIDIIKGGFKSGTTAATCGFAGGIVGKSGTAKNVKSLTISDCLTLGVVTNSSDAIVNGVASILGYASNSTPAQGYKRDVITNSWYVVHSTINAVSQTVGCKNATVDGVNTTSGDGSLKNELKQVQYADRLTAEQWSALNTTYWQIEEGSTPMLKCFLTAN